MEGVQPPPRKPRTAVAQKKPVKEKPKPKSRSKIKPEKKLKKEDPEVMQGEPGQPIAGPDEQASVEPSTRIKDEPLENSYQGDVGDMEWMSLEPHSYPEKELTAPKLEEVDPSLTGAVHAIKEEPRVKIEPTWN